MRAIGRWFRKQALWQGKIVVLEDTLLSGRFGAYAYYRLRYFFGRTLVAASLHFIEFLFLSFIFADLELISALLVRTATTFAISYWWGGLEVMRQRIRELRGEQRIYRVPDVVADWIVTALLCATAVVALTSAWVLLDASRVGHTFTLFHAYVLANGVRLACTLLTRTFHSGVYALRRIYRPLWSIVGIDLSAFVGAMLLWPILGPWSFPALLVAATASSSALTVVFTTRSYRLMGLYPTELTVNYRSALLRPLSFQFALAGLSYALMKLDAVVLLALYYGAYQGDSELFLVFYLISPFIRASSDWAQLFYFDLKRLDLDMLTRFRRKFERFVGHLAPVVGLLFWSLASLTATVLVQRNLGSAVYLALAAFFLVRSRLAFYQIRAFAQRQYLQLFLAGGFLLSGAVLIGFVLGGGIEKKVTYLALVLLFALGYLQRKARQRGFLSEPAILAPQAWLRRLVGTESQLTLHCVQIDEEATDLVVRNLAIAIAKRLGPTGAVTMVVKRRVLWFACQGSRTQIDRVWFHRKSGGMVDWARTVPECANGAEAVEQLRKRKFLGRGLSEPPHGARGPLTIEELKKRFLTLVPGGVVFEPGKAAPASAARLSRGDRQEIMRTAIRYARNLFDPSGRSKYDVSALCNDGAIRLVFTARRAVSKIRRLRWRRFIEAVNLRSSVRSNIVDTGEGRSTMRHKRIVGWAVALTTVFCLLTFVSGEDRATGRFELRLANRAEVRAPAAGFLRECLFDEGDRVKAGETICHMEMPDLASRIAQKQVEAQTLRKILQSMRGRGADARAADWARLAGLEEETRYLKQVQERLVLKSTVDGVITTPRLRRSVGRYFREGELIFEVQEPSVLEAEIVLPEKRIGRVQEGHRVKLKALAFPYETFHGAVDRVAPAAIVSLDAEQSTVTAYCRLEDGTSKLRPGMTGYAQILLGRRPIGRILLDRVSRFIRTEFWW